MTDNLKIFQQGGSVMLVLTMLLMSAAPAWAHKVYIFAWAEKGMVFTESSFGDKKVRQGKIEVVDETGKIVLSGITDNEGNFSFPIPENSESDLVINLDAAMGHQAVWRITYEELSQGASPLSAPSKETVETRKKLAQGPGAVKIITGIGIIFSLAGATAFFRNFRNRRKTDG